MYADLDAVFRAHLSGARAQNQTARITEFYRSPGSSGYHAATQLVAHAIREAGAEEVREERYPLDGQTRILGRTMPPAWEPEDGELDLVAPVQDRLISFREVPSTLPWWCGSTPPGGARVRVVDVERGLSPADYEGKPVQGNAVLIRDSEFRPAWAHAADLARQHGAVGIITDFLHSQTPPWRTRRALPEAVQLLRLAPRWDNPWAFAVGYDTAQHLAMLARQGPVEVHAKVRTRTFRGEGVNLMAMIRGAQRPEESVFFIAHTSAGTKPCANCAAGPALMIELCRAITTAIGRGDLPRPVRSIRFLFVAEGHGSVFFLNTHRDALPNIKATICLDSVGHNQARLKSSLVHYRAPDSTPSFINDLSTALIDELPKDAEWPFKNGPMIALSSFQTLPYTPWSDNHYWAAAGIPAPLFMSWPDLYFHTQLLTADHTDPAVFERCGRILGSLAIGIARAGSAEVGPLMQEVAGRAALRVSRAARRALADGGRDRARREIEYLVRRDAEAIRTALVLAGDGGDTVHLRAFADELVAELESRVATEVRRLETYGGRHGETKAVEEERTEADCVIPRRAPHTLAPGVVGLSYEEMASLVEAMQREDSTVNWETLRIFGDELWNFTDGKRTLSAIAEAICIEFGFDVHAKHFLALARGLESAGVLTLDRLV